MVTSIKEHAETTSELKSILLLALKIKISLHGYQEYPCRCNIINGLSAMSGINQMENNISRFLPLSSSRH
jgi:hypothetical protein